MTIEFQKWDDNITQLLNDGQIMLYPSDTIWAIGCDATNEEACLRILKLKERSTEKSFIVLMDSFKMLKKYVPNFHPICYDLIENAIKPITIIYPYSIGLASSVVAKDCSVGVRLTKDLLCLQMLHNIKKPIVSTSANISNESFPKSFADISHKIKIGVDFIVKKTTDYDMNAVSKIIKVDFDGQQKIIRP